MEKFAAIRKRSIKRKGSEAALLQLLPKVASTRKLNATKDARYLSRMTKCINKAGFHWGVIEKKWPEFEEAFFNFDVDRLSMLSPEQWEAYMSDTRVVRNWQKISALIANVAFVRELSQEHNGFGRFLSAWPSSDQVGLLKQLKKEGSRLGGQTGQWFLREMGKDGFVLSRDVVIAIQNAGVDINDQPTSMRDLGRVQDAFNQWHEESGLPYTHISKICSYSAGTNYSQEELLEYMNK